MYLSTALLSTLSATFTEAAVTRPQQQHGAIQNDQQPISGLDKGRGVGHFSEWSRNTKREFLMDWQADKQGEWIFVQGNEAGDLDSMTSALAWAYHLEHSTMNTSKPLKAIALLQTPKDALDLRPENKLALHNAKMTPEHADLLTIEELPEDPETLSRKIKGVVLVDHDKPMHRWDNAKILSIFDHHKDSGYAPEAKPRIFEKVASCTTIVARQMLDELEKLPEEYHMPHEMLELILSAIAFDSNGLKKKDSTDADRQTAKRVLKRSNWSDRNLKKVMKKIEDELDDHKNDIEHLGVRDLLRRDWKGVLIDTPSKRTPTVNLGLASIPFSLDDQIKKTEFEELFDWFAIEAAWTATIDTDISIALNNYKIRGKNGDKHKIREIVLTVRDDVRIDEEQAYDLFATVSKAIEDSEELNVKPWHKADKLGKRQMVWVNQCEGCGRKVVQPIVEAAVKNWDM